VAHSVSKSEDVTLRHFWGHRSADGGGAGASGLQNQLDFEVDVQPELTKVYFWTRGSAAAPAMRGSTHDAVQGTTPICSMLETNMGYVSL
jgi:hypothetical protein